MQDKTVKQNQNIILENRKSLSISGITDVDSFDEKTELESWSYALLPVWVTTYKFKDEIMPFAINGQSGKTYGRLPLNPAKLAVFSMIVAAAAFGLSLLGGMLLL